MENYHTGRPVTKDHFHFATTNNAYIYTYNNNINNK